MKIKTAIVGYGGSGERMHGRAIAADARYEVIAICDPVAQRRDVGAATFGCATYADLSCMLQRESPDLVCIVTRNDQHGDMTIAALQAGAHVMVTKPWALNEDEAMRMVAAESAAGKRIFPWLPARWGCDFTRLRELVAAGTIGNLVMVRRTVTHFKPRNDWQTESRYGGGYLLNWGPHIVEPPVLLGGAPVKSVYGLMRQVLIDGDTEDLFLATLTLENGVVVIAEHTVSAEPLPSWVVQGDAGTIVVYDHAMTVHRRVLNAAGSPDGPVKEEAVDQETLSGDLYGSSAAVYADMAEALQNHKPFAVTSADALELTCVLDAVRRSHATRAAETR
ncbi:MAG: Gfo/Idh/MocA family oxidoreductase [Verrucomicrobia bacterium]|nr:Gfo/Idh/MocA family oxidoreductase [Verrucomicrobiota bacterium]